MAEVYATMLAFRQRCERQQEPDATLRWQLPHQPYPSPPPPRGRVPPSQHAQLSAEPLDWSQLAPPSPLAPPAARHRHRNLMRRNLAHNAILDTKWTNFEFGEKRLRNG